MSVTVANIYRGPLASIQIDAGGQAAPWDDLGAIGANSAEITFEGVTYESNEGHNIELFGKGKVVIELAESDTTHLALIDRTTVRKLVLTALDAKTYTIDNIFLVLSVKRGFGADPHLVTIMGTKAAVDEDGFVAIGLPS